MNRLFKYPNPQCGVLFDERTGGINAFLDLKRIAKIVNVGHRTLRRTARTKRVYMGAFTAWWMPVQHETIHTNIKPIK